MKRKNERIANIKGVNLSANASLLSGIKVDEFDFLEGVVTKWEGVIVPMHDEWFLEKGYVKFSALSFYATDGFISRLKITLAFRTKRNAYESVNNDYYRLREFLKFIISRGGGVINVITEEHIVWWRAALIEGGREHQLGALRGMLLDSVMLLDEPLLTEEAAKHLRVIKLPGNPKGSRVNDPDLGRMTMSERQIFETKARQAYERGRLSSQEFFTLILFNSFGLRLVDYVSLKVSDVHINVSGELITKATIDIPCGKSGGPPRSKMSMGNPVDNDVAILLKKISSGRQLDSSLFEIPGCESPLQTGILDGHSTVVAASRYLAKIIEKINVPFHLNSYRFRYTVGTEAFRESGSPYVTAKVLRQSDIQNVKVYVNEIVLAQAHDRVVAEVFKDINALIDSAVKTNSFSGVVITKQNYKNKKLIPVRAREQVGDFQPIGGCAGSCGCAKGAPVACYCCQKFRPIKESNHYGMLCATVSEFLSIVETDGKIATSLVSSILGMAQVCYLTGSGSSKIKDAKNG